ncbi:Uncharacterized protein HZ326_11246 [Fusarium oxysporum f. sp. albedinis]|nr:Uncharacterized protein HZ326_11246 [Fusarium oxysporum f. sp. albedinis]
MPWSKTYRYTIKSVKALSRTRTILLCRRSGLQTYIQPADHVCSTSLGSSKLVTHALITSLGHDQEASKANFYFTSDTLKHHLTNEITYQLTTPTLTPLSNSHRPAHDWLQRHQMWIP